MVVKLCERCGAELLPKARSSRCVKCRAELRSEQKSAARKVDPERTREQDHIYYMNQREKRAESGRQYRADHAEEIAERMWRYSRANLEEGATRSRRRYARKLSAEGTHTAEDIKMQYDRQKGKCFYCGEFVGQKYHVDHVIPLSLGGSNGPENLVISCPSCNLSKYTKHPMDFCGRLF